MRKIEINNRMVLSAVSIYIFFMTSTGCSKKDQQKAQDNTSDAVNDTFDATKRVLKDAAEGINNAVYHK